MAIDRSLRRRIRLTVVAAVAALGALVVAPVGAYAATPAPTEVRVADTERVPPRFYEPIVGTWEGGLEGAFFTMSVQPLDETTFRGVLVGGDIPEPPGCVLLTVTGKGLHYSGTGFGNCDGTGSAFDVEVDVSFNMRVMTVHPSGDDGDAVPLVFNRVR